MTTPMDDLELFERWQQGDQDAGNQLLKRHFHSLYRFFRNKVQSDIDELIQSTFLACVRSRDRFRKNSSFRTYLFTIARNELYGYLRRRKRGEETLDFGVTSVMDMGTSPTGRLARNQQYNLLLQALRSLPVEQQVLLELYYWEEMSVAELSELLDIAPPATRTRLTRGRKALREMLEKLASKNTLRADQIEDLDTWARSMRGKWESGEGG